MGMSVIMWSTVKTAAASASHTYRFCILLVDSFTQSTEQCSRHELDCAGFSAGALHIECGRHCLQTGEHQDTVLFFHLAVLMYMVLPQSLKLTGPGMRTCNSTNVVGKLFVCEL